MQESVALDSSKQKEFVKSIRQIKKLVKKNLINEEDTKTTTFPKLDKTKKRIIRKKPRQPKGLVYLGHIPHGFYEHEMTQYFKQFGAVTNARVIRSKRTGASKGCAFVEFKEPAVAQIVAETMNNYLMGKRLLKAAYIPPEKQRRNALRRKWNQKNNPGRDMRMKVKKAYNSNKDDQKELKWARKQLSNLSTAKKKLSELGINYDFFMPVDIPEALINEVNVKQEPEDKRTIAKKNKKDKSSQNNDHKKASQESEVKIKVVTNRVENQKEQNKTSKKENVKEVNTNKAKKVEEKKDQNKTKKGKKEVNVEKAINVEDQKDQNKNKKGKKGVIVEHEQKEKQQKLKEAGVKPVENFIKINEESDDDSDSEYEFDSDEYEKMLHNEDEDSSDVASGDDTDDGDQDEDESDENNDETPVKIMKRTRKAETLKGPVDNKKVKRVENPKLDAAVKSKKPKFNKQNTQRTIKKQFKKK